MERKNVRFTRARESTLVKNRFKKTKTIKKKFTAARFHITVFFLLLPSLFVGPQASRAVSGGREEVGGVQGQNYDLDVRIAPNVRAPKAVTATPHTTFLRMGQGDSADRPPARSSLKAIRPSQP